MGSEYTIIENENGILVMVDEMSNSFDVRVECQESNILQSPTGTEGEEDDCSITVAKYLSPEQLAEVGLKFLKVALYWPAGGDIDDFRAWLHKRVDEVDHSEHTTFGDFLFMKGV